MDIIYDEEQYAGEELSSEEAKFLLATIDPHETDQIIFSEIVKLFTTHPAKLEPTSRGEVPLDQVSVLEKFVTKAIEQEESQKRIMIKLQERIIEESKNEDQPEEYEELDEDDDTKEHVFSRNQSKPYTESHHDYEDDEHEEGEHVEESEPTENKEIEVREKPRNYLGKSLDPVEEDDKEEQSIRSPDDTLRKRPSNGKILKHEC